VDELRQISVIFRSEWRRTVRSARVVVLLLLFAMFSLLALLIVGSIANALDRQVQAQLAAGVDPATAQQMLEQGRQGVLGFFFSKDPSALEALSHIPLVVLIVFRITLFFLPLYIALMGFDQLSGEIGPRSIRYLLVRAPRSAIVLGKFLGQAAVLLGLVLLIDFAILFYARLTHPDFPAALAALTLAKLWIAAIVFSLAYLGITTFCSALFRTPAVSLVFNIVLLFTFWLLESIGASVDVLSSATPDASPSPYSYLRYVSPSHYSTGLLHPSFGHYAPSALAFAGFALVFLAAAYAVMRERDL
jgi:ABC-type transport system involved in multi-copper enzyme maturation permease subunit